MTDKIHRFIFDAYAIRGEMIRLEESCQQMLKGHHYPEVIQSLLQQTAAASVMLATTLKFEGKISIQLTSQNAIKMLLVQTTHTLGYRGLARYDDSVDYSSLAFNDLIEDGQMSITIEPKKGKRYQGIVPLTGDSIAECIENYFNQSEQLKTRIWLFNNNSQVYGLMLQALPDMASEDSFDHLVYLASTLAKDESLSVDNEILLHRLFHQESINNLVADPVTFNCGCSEKKMLDSIRLLPAEEIQEILKQKGAIDVKCEFCLNGYSFDDLAIKANQSLDGSATKH
jgi:molecular chaperone Hsp33